MHLFTSWLPIGSHVTAEDETATDGIADDNGRIADEVIGTEVKSSDDAGSEFICDEVNGTEIAAADETLSVICYLKSAKNIQLSSYKGCCINSN